MADYSASKDIEKSGSHEGTPTDSAPAPIESARAKRLLTQKLPMNIGARVLLYGKGGLVVGIKRDGYIYYPDDLAGKPIANDLHPESST